MRLPARKLERVVVERLAQLFDDPLQLIATVDLQVRPDQLGQVHERSRVLAAELRQHGDSAGDILVQVRICDTSVELVCDRVALAGALGVTAAPGAPQTLSIAVDAALRRSGRALRLVQSDRAAPAGSPDPALVRLLVLARRWWSELRRGELDVTALAIREQRSPSYVTRIVRLAFLSPAVTAAILAGKQRAGVDVAKLTLRESVLTSWNEQARALLAA